MRTRQIYAGRRWARWGYAGLGLCGLVLPPTMVRAQAVAGDDPANLKGERVRAVEAEPLEVDRGAKGVAGMLKKLGTRASLLMIVAHPDDEDGGMLTYESRGVGARVGMLTLTRGEGGQNVMSGDFNDALGLVRTRELLAADQYLGVDQMFGTEVDFGFSKTKEEAFSQWTHERVLYDAVRAVRLYRPLVVTSVFLGAPTDGHGQHQVSGEIAQEVFNAAANPKVFPEMGLPVWAPTKVYGRMPFAQVSAGGMFDYATGKTVPVQFENYVTGTISHQGPQPTVMVPEGETSSLLGGSYVQFARQGLALQKTQIGSGARLAPAGRFDVGYTRYGSRVGVKDKEADFFEGVDVSLVGIAELAPSISQDQRDGLVGALRQIDGFVKEATSEFDAEHPEKTATTLRQGLQVLDTLIAQAKNAQGVQERERYDVLHELRVKRVQFNEALVDALGLEMTARVVADGNKRETATPQELLQMNLKDHLTQPPRVVIPGQKVTVQIEVKNGAEPVRVQEETAQFARSIAVGQRTGRSGEMAQVAAHGVQAEQIFPSVATNAPFTRPYYTRKTVEQSFYDVLVPELRNAPTTPAALTAWERVEWQGVSLDLGAVVRVYLDGDGKDQWLQPLTIVPPIRLAITPAVAILPESKHTFDVQAEVKTELQTETDGSMKLDLPARWMATPPARTFQLTNTEAGQAIPFQLTPVGMKSGQRSVTASAEYGGTIYREGYRAVGYSGIVHDLLFDPATTRVQGVDLVGPAGLKVAYLPGTGDAVEDALEQLGVTVARVSVGDIAAGKLAGYDALVMGVRAYAAHKDLARVTAQVTAFARAGGVVVVQYNTAEFGGADAPYPLTLGSAEKVVEEHAPVKLLDPKSQVLSWPNRMTEHDFDGWVEERGHGFMGSWDPKFAAVTEVHDAGQDPQRGGLLVAPVGKGDYVYCAYALYRQLPEGVPGAFRLLANLISLGRRP